MRITSAKAVWKGNLKEGNGRYHLNSSGYEDAYSFATRFGDSKGSNPEELIGAAHAACFSMALSNIVDGEGYKPVELKTKASVKMDAVEGGSAITSIHLETEAKIEGIDNDTFQKLAEKAKENCPVSKALAALEITLEANLV